MKKISFIAAALLLFSPIFSAQAVVQSLDGITSQEQSFVDDTNIKINASGNNHVITWDGLLDSSRGGTGADLTEFEEGSLLFWDGNSTAEDNASLSWDSTTNQLEIDGDIIATGSAAIEAQSVIANTSLSLFDHASLDFYADMGESVMGGIQMADVGLYTFTNPNGYATFDVTLLNEARSFVFPDSSGTLSLLESNQTFTGLNLFQASSNSTIYVGSGSLTGCIAMGDSDGSGITYITALNGLLISSTIKPSICQ